MGSARMKTRFFGVLSATDEGSTREGIRVGFELIVDEVGLPKLDGDC